MALILTNAGPSIDGDLIPDSPHSLLEQGAFAPIPFISGNNADE
jgi:cholinesterase